MRVHARVSGAVMGRRSSGMVAGWLRNGDKAVEGGMDANGTGIRIV